ncbi:PhnA protein [Pedobacter ginsengisoli]|uniref:PhnA protein n=1 Tax=Pedobacter ginsengisoli TaxID=363852 RepID=A0A2D1U138_9SPHI|nr:alkylphosphonate utilization protein [Pedobacter ginsengisoli]ATP55309.1 PhnA protein [Pedobacter ginsengisoli]
MKLEEQLFERSENKCELCGSEDNLSIYEVPPQTQNTAEECVVACGKCLAQIEKKEVLDSKHWQCLTGSMWSEVPGVQVVSWRMLNRLRQESWAIDNLDMIYLDDETLAWAKATGDHENDSTVEFHRDSNNNILENGDTVVIIKTLDVKGSSLSAKLGTVVKNIKLVDDNKEQIEGRVEGQLIVILTKYVRKQS